MTNKIDLIRSSKIYKICGVIGIILPALFVYFMTIPTRLNPLIFLDHLFAMFLILFLGLVFLLILLTYSLYVIFVKKHCMQDIKLKIHWAYDIGVIAITCFESLILGFLLIKFIN